MYNNFVVNSLSFGKCPLEALDNNGGVVGSWNESRPSHQLNNDAQDDYTGIIYGLHFVKNFSRYVRQQGAAINVPPQKNCNFSELARYFTTKFCAIILNGWLHNYCTSV